LAFILPVHCSKDAGFFSLLAIIPPEEGTITTLITHNSNNTTNAVEDSRKLLEMNKLSRTNAEMYISEMPIIAHIFAHPPASKKSAPDVMMMNRFITMPTNSGIEMLTITARYFPNSNVPLGTAFDSVNLRVPFSRSPDMAS
jgi:hypothetical protein